jgi:hypothetical protein
MKDENRQVKAFPRRRRPNLASLVERLHFPTMAATDWDEKSLMR